MSHDKQTPGSPQKGERIAKALARAGVGSRREIERMIEAGRVRVGGEILASPAHNIASLDGITVDGQPVRAGERARLWRYHKPRGLVTTHRDPRGRATVFEQLPRTLPRVVSVGRLDLNSEGLLLLTNDGSLARWMELPAHAFVRRYRVRAYGMIDEAKLDLIRAGAIVDGIVYEPAQVRVDRASGDNAWLEVELTEGKNREIRRLLGFVGLEVNRLIRTGYGPFTLGSMPKGGLAEVPSKALAGALKAFFQANPGSVAVEGKPVDPSKWAKPKPRRPRPKARLRPSPHSGPTRRG